MVFSFLKRSICKSGLSFCTILLHQNLHLTMINSNDNAPTETYTYKHTHTWIFNGIEMYLNMRSLVIKWHYSFSRLLNNISVAGKPFVSSYQGFDWEKERNRQYFHNHMWATFKPHKTIKHHVVYFTSVQNHWKAHNMTYKDYCQVFLNKSKIR